MPNETISQFPQAPQHHPQDTTRPALDTRIDPQLWAEILRDGLTWIVDRQDDCEELCAEWSVRESCPRIWTI